MWWTFYTIRTQKLKSMKVKGCVFIHIVIIEKVYVTIIFRVSQYIFMFDEKTKKRKNETERMLYKKPCSSTRT